MTASRISFSVGPLPPARFCRRLPILSPTPGLTPRGRLSIQIVFNRQGAADDKNIFNDCADLRDFHTILIPFVESELPLILGLDSFPIGHLDAADDKEQIENNQVLTT